METYEIVGVVFVVIFSMGMFLISQLAFFAVSKKVEDLKKQALERGYAEYNQTNGKWQWRDK